MAKNRFYLYTEYRAYLDGMTVEDQAQLFRTILDYECGNELEELSPAVKAVFSFIKNRLDNNRTEYEKVCETRKESGQKGGEANSSKSKQKVANGSKSKQKVANGSKPKQKVANAKFSCSDNDNDNENDNEYEKENENDKECNTPLTPLPGEWDWDKHSNLDNVKHLLNHGQYDRADYLQMQEGLWECVKTWMEYKDAKKPRSSNHYANEASISALLNKFVENCETYGERAVIDAVNDSLAAGYQGIVWDKVKGRASPKRQEEEFLEKWRNA